MCLLMRNNPNRINVTDIVIVHLGYGEVIEGTVVKTPCWFSKDWVILQRNSRALIYVKDYIYIELVMKKQELTGE